MSLNSDSMKLSAYLLDWHRFHADCSQFRARWFGQISTRKPVVLPKPSEDISQVNGIMTLINHVDGNQTVLPLQKFRLNRASDFQYFTF